MKGDINPPVVKINIDTVNKTQKSQAFEKKTIHPSGTNLNKINHWINQGLIKLLKKKT